MANNITLVPTLAKIRVTDTYRIGKWQESGSGLTMELSAFLTLSSIMKAAKTTMLSLMEQGGCRFDMLLPYTSDHIMEPAEIDGETIDTRGKQMCDRLLLLTPAGHTSAMATGELATIYGKKKQIVFKIGAEAYDTLPFGHRSSIVVHDFEGSSWIFNTLLVHLPDPDSDDGHYIYSDGSDAGDQKKDQPIDWGGGYVGRIAEKPFMGRVSGRSVGGNADAELAAAAEALEKAAELAEPDRDITIFFDYVGVGYWPLGLWKSKTDEAAAFVNNVEILAHRFASIRFIHVDGHSGVRGNELADRIANIKQ